MAGRGFCAISEQIMSELGTHELFKQKLRKYGGNIRENSQTAVAFFLNMC